MPEVYHHPEVRCSPSYLHAGFEINIPNCTPPKRRPLSLRLQIKINFQVNFCLEDCSQMQEVFINSVLRLTRFNFTPSLSNSVLWQRVGYPPSSL